MQHFFVTNLLFTQASYIFYATVAVGIFGYFLFRPLFYMALIFLLFSLYFFRNPDRVCAPALVDSTVLICPSDGTVVDVQYDASAPFNGYLQKVSIFLSPLDVHLQWAPMAGIVEKINYRPGKFSMAFLPKSSELNERNDLLLKNDRGNSLMVCQIAGSIARKICCWTHVGDNLKAGQKYGMIRFGSRVEVFLPANVDLHVGVGQRVYGGQTVLGHWLK